MKPTFLSSLILTLLIPQSVCSQIIPDSLEIKTDAVFREYNTGMGPGCAVAIISNGKTVLRKGYGMANLEHNIPVTPETVFDIASVAKQFTGLAISSLIQEGTISADDDIRKYLPYVPDFGKTITISHLLHHTGGLRDWPETLGIAGWQADDVISFENIRSLIEHQKELDFEPGTRFSYSNTGYNLLAAVVEKVSGKTFAEWINDNIFSSIKMNSSQIREDHTLIIKNLADSYFLKDNKFIKTPDLLSAYGSSSLFTSLEDMVLWGIHFDKKVSRKNPVYMRMLEPGRLASGDTVNYGFGLGLSKEGEPKRIAHSGAWAGFRSIIAYYPDEHLSIIILSNSGNFIPRVSSEKIADIMLQREVQTEPHVFDLKKAATVRLNKNLAEKYVGTYRLDTDWNITISLKNNGLWCRTNGEGPYPMVAKSDSIFWVDAYNNSIILVNSSEGYLLKYRNILSERIIPFAPGTDLLNQYIGTYYSKELATEYRMTVSAGKLRMYHIRLGDIELFPDPVEGTFGSEIGKFSFVKNSRDEITGFDLSRYRVRNIHFDKQ